jgi:hypothetical protein
MDIKLIAAALDPDKFLGKKVIVLGDPRERYPYGTSREDRQSGKVRPEGYTLKVGSPVVFENFNVRLPLEADLTGLKLRDQVELVEPELSLRGKADGDFVNIDVMVEAKGIRKAQ